MKIRRHIALLILAVYAFASGGRAAESLLCPCSCHAEHHADEECCLICLHRHSSAESPAHCHVEDHDLCHHNHISPQELYTLTQDDDRTLNRQSLMPVWAVCSADNGAGAILTAASTCRYGRWRSPLPHPFLRAPKALRAPPTRA